MAALIAWRPTKGIYKLHPALAEALTDTALEGDVPSHLLLRMPSHAVYVDTSEISLPNYPFAGFFAFLSRLGEEDELELVALTRPETEQPEAMAAYWNDVVSFSLPLGNHPIADLVRLGFSKGEGAPSGNSFSEATSDVQDALVLMASSLVSQLLYLCSEEPDIRNWAPPTPSTKVFGRTKRILAAKAPTTWDVGYRIGAQLDLTAKQVASTQAEPGGAGSSYVRAHVRRAHWHSFWTGKREAPTLRLKWLAPIVVNAQEDQALPAVVRTVIPRT